MMIFSNEVRNFRFKKALKHEFLDCEHRFLISDFAEPALKLVSR